MCFNSRHWLSSNQCRATLSVLLHVAAAKLLSPPHPHRSVLPARSVIWLQKRHEEMMERLRGPTPRKDTMQTEFKIGRLRQDCVTVPRGERVSPLQSLGQVWGCELVRMEAVY